MKRRTAGRLFLLACFCLFVGNVLGDLPREVERGPRGKKQIALTFDAGAEADCFSDLVATLAQARVRATFFITGVWAEENPGCAREIVRRGHEIGNHTWRHLDLTRQSARVIETELRHGETMLVWHTGMNPRPLWRAPFGARDGRVLRVAGRLGYRSIYWTLDSLDSVEPPKSAAFLVDRVTSRSDRELDGAIVLLHVGMSSTAEALPAIVANLQGRGFRLVRVSELLQERK